MNEDIKADRVQQAVCNVCRVCPIRSVVVGVEVVGCCLVIGWSGGGGQCESVA
jgi:hypothetical protein